MSQIKSKLRALRHLVAKGTAPHLSTFSWNASSQTSSPFCSGVFCLLPPHSALQPGSKSSDWLLLSGQQPFLLLLAPQTSDPTDQAADGQEIDRSEALPQKGWIRPASLSIPSPPSRLPANPCSRFHFSGTFGRKLEQKWVQKNQVSDVGGSSFPVISSLRAIEREACFLSGAESGSRLGY